MKTEDSETKSHSRRALPKKCILLVDDDAPCREVISESLAVNGYDVIEAVDGEDAFFKIATAPRPISLMLTDRQMPKVGGIELVNYLDTRPSGRLFPVIIASGDFSDEDRLRIKKLRYPVPTIEKPYKMTELLALIGKILGSLCCDLSVPTVRLESHG